MTRVFMWAKGTVAHRLDAQERTTICGRSVLGEYGFCLPETQFRPVTCKRCNNNGKR